MKKFAVFSGFHGSGKTTTMIALTKYYTAHHGKAAMISNDLGDGVNLADHRLARLSGCNASEIVNECICFCHDVLTDRLNRSYADGCELVLSDIPGFGVGALEHVYHGLNEGFPNQYEFAPFTVLAEPRTVELLRGGSGGDMAHILDAQLMEADLIVLNKCDLISEEQAGADRLWLSLRYPEAQALCISALTEDGLEELSLALRDGAASLRHPDIDYEDIDLQNEMGSLSEHYIQYHATVCCFTFDGTAYLTDMAKRVQEEVLAAGCQVPHLKLLAWEPEGDFGKVDLLGTDRPIEVTRRFSRPCTDIAVILNANAACPAETLDRIITETVETVSDRYQLELLIFKKVCMSMGE